MGGKNGKGGAGRGPDRDPAGPEAPAPEALVPDAPAPDAAKPDGGPPEAIAPKAAPAQEASAPEASGPETPAPGAAPPEGGARPEDPGEGDSCPGGPGGGGSGGQDGPAGDVSGQGGPVRGVSGQVGPGGGGPGGPAARGVLSPAASGGEAGLEAALRPPSLKEFLGQAELKETLAVFIGAAKNRGESLDHVLIHGHPGLGKTTLAHILSHEMGAALKKTSGPVIERAGDLASLLTNLERGDVLFIDEIHRLSPVVEEILYPAMEDFKLDLMIGQGPGARSVRLDLPRFTLIGATTRAGMLTSPLRDRFGIRLRLDYYSPDELALIVKRAAALLGAGIDEGGAGEIARRCRGTPRIAGRLLRRVRDFAEFKGDGLIDRQTADKALAMLGVDRLGLDELDRRILEVVCARYSGGPVGLDTLATAVGEEAETIQEVCEPYLIQEGFIHRSPRGRLATRKAFEHIGLPVPPRLF